MKRNFSIFVAHKLLKTTMHFLHCKKRMLRKIEGKKEKTGEKMRFIITNLTSICGIYKQI